MAPWVFAQPTPSRLQRQEELQRRAEEEKRKAEDEQRRRPVSLTAGRGGGGRSIYSFFVLLFFGWVGLTVGFLVFGVSQIKMDCGSSFGRYLRETQRTPLPL